MENNKTKKSFKVINLNTAYTVPVNKINNKKGYIEWGDNNQYPKYPIELYNYRGSATHKAIINKKVKLISGNGFVWDNMSQEMQDFVMKNNLEKEVRKATLDYELFNGFAFEVIWSRDKSVITTIKHLPFHNIRIGVENDEIPFEYYWYCNDWALSNKKDYQPVFIKGFNKYIKEGKQLFYYSEYNPLSLGLYPIAGYSTSFNWIEMDFEISQFHLNQVKQGYSPSFILNFATGIPSEEEMDSYYKEFKRNYAGSENSGKIIITYSEGVDGKPEFIPITLNDSDERFIMLMSQIESNIVVGHEIPPQLVIMTPGKLGSTDERKELLAEFQSYYINGRQAVIEEVLNTILSTFTNEKLKLNQYTNNDESNLLTD